MRRASRLAGLVVAGATALGTGGILAMAAPAGAAEDAPKTIYVNKDADGFQPTNGKSCDKPNYKKIETGVKNASSGDTVKVCDAKYQLDKTAVTVSADNVTVEAADPDKKPTIDAGAYDSNNVPFRVAADGVTVKNLKVANSQGDGIYASGVNGLVLDGNEFSGSKIDGIVVTGSGSNKDVVVENNKFDTPDGATNVMVLKNVQNGTVASNEITGASEHPGVALVGGNDTVTVQGNTIEQSKAAVYLGQAAGDEPNKNVAVHANSFDKSDGYGLAVNDSDNVLDGTLDASNNYWGCSEGANEDDCAKAQNVAIKDGKFADDNGDDNIDTGDPLKAALSGSTSATTINTDDESVTAEVTQTGAIATGSGTVTASEFSDNPKSDIDPTAGKFFDVTTSQDSQFSDVGVADKNKDANSLRWHDGSKWAKLEHAQEKHYPGKGVAAHIASNSSPSLKDLTGTVFVGKQAEKPAPVGGPMASGPHYGIADQTDLFTVDPDGNVTARWVKDSKGWNGPRQLADNASDGSKIATTKHYGMKHQTDTFYRGEDGKLHAVYNYGTGWKQAPIPGTKVAKNSGIAASKHFGTKNQTDVFYQGEDGKLHAAYNYGKGWKDTVVGKKGEVQDGSDITASQHYGVKHPQTDVFYTGKDGQLSATYHNGKQWKTAEEIGGAKDISNSGLAAAKDAATGGTDVFYADADAKMQRAHVDPKSGGWHSTPLKGTASGKSGIAASPHYTVKGQTDVFYVGDDSKLHAAYGNGKSWKDAALPKANDVKGSSDLTATEQRGIAGGQTDAFYTDGSEQTNVAFNNGKRWNNQPLSP